MPCKDFEDALSAFADGRCEPAERTLVESHLTSCGDCRTYLRWVQGLKKAVGRIPMPSAPEDLNAGLTKRHNNIPLTLPSPQRKEGRHWILPRLSWGLAAACAGLAVIFALRHYQAPPRLSVDWMLAIHNQYQLSIPAPSKELAFSNLADHLAAGLDQGSSHAL
jgi:anti-sigma factor RsiW